MFMMDYTNDTFHIPFVKLRQWYLSNDDLEAFRRLVKRGVHWLTDGFLPERFMRRRSEGTVQLELFEVG